MMAGMVTATILNRFEHSTIKNQHLPVEWQEQAALDELAEFLQANWEQRAVFYDDGEVSSRQKYLGFTGQKGVRTGKYIGTIAFKGCQLNIFPKVFREDSGDNDTDGLDVAHLMKNLVQWLRYCNRVEYPFISIAGKLEDATDLRELFVTLYLHYVKQALEYGAYYRYEDRTCDLGVVRGRIDLRDYATRKLPAGQANHFRCEFANFEFDNMVNRIIKCTCKGLMNNATSADNQRLIRQILIRLNDVADVRCQPADCDTVRLSRLHRHYAVLLSMSKMFLLNRTTGYEIDTQQSFCFLFPAELLFEGFIGGFISEVLEGEATVRLQASDQTLIDNVCYDGQDLGRAFTMRHDILVEQADHGMFVLDTKYKQMPRFAGNADVKSAVTDFVKQADIYQVVEYAAHRGLSRAYLLYPMYRFEPEEPSDVVLERVSQAGQRIDIHIVRLPFVFEDDIEKTRSMLTAAIRKIFS